MKKGLLLAGVLSLFIGTASKAQNFHYGLKASLLFAGLHGNGMESSMKPGFQGGIYGEMDFGESKKFGFQPEILFTQATANKADDFKTYYVEATNTYANKKLKLSYITVPLLARYSPISNLTFNLGVQGQYMFYADENLLKGNRDALKKMDVGAVAGVQVKVATVRFFGRYVMGISNVNDVDNRYTWRSNQIAIGMGVNIK